MSTESSDSKFLRNIIKKNKHFTNAESFDIGVKFSYGDYYVIINIISFMVINIRILLGQKIIIDKNVSRSDASPKKITGLINKEIQDAKVTDENSPNLLENIGKIETYPKNSNKRNNYGEIVDTNATYLTEIGKEIINLGLLAIGNGRFELDIIYTFYENPENVDKRLNLIIYESYINERTMLIQKNFVRILQRISRNINYKFIYFEKDRKRKNWNSIPLNEIDCIIGLQPQHQTFLKNAYTRINKNVKYI